MLDKWAVKKRLQQLWIVNHLHKDKKQQVINELEEETEIAQYQGYKCDCSKFEQL
jgi:hypothetical protein